MNLCRIGKFDIVAIYKVDRISRNITDFVKIYEELKSLNVKLVSVTEGFDTQTPMGEMKKTNVVGYSAFVFQRMLDHLNGIINSYNAGCKSIYESAEYLDVTEEFLLECIECYRSKYGVCTTFDNYVIYFEPNLGVLELI